MQTRTVPEGIAAKLGAAADLFAERGLDDTKMEDVASVTGVPKATLYYYFSGKQDILAFLFRDTLAAVGEAVARAASGPGDAATRLQAVIRAHLAVFVERPAASRALQFDLGRAARIPDIAAAAERAFIEPVSTLLAEGVHDGSLRGVPHPRLTATAILGTVTTLAMNALTTEPRRDVTEVTNVISALVFDGLRA
jgi:TetR/AcrR family transcriptional regulator